MRIKITKGGIFGKDGEIAIGTEMTVSDEPLGWAGRYEVISRTEGKTEIVNLAPAPKGPFVAKEKSPGWFSIFDADGNPVGKSFRETDAAAFNRLDDGDKQKAVDEAVKAAA